MNGDQIRDLIMAYGTNLNPVWISALGVVVYSGADAKFEAYANTKGDSMFINDLDTDDGLSSGILATPTESMRWLAGRVLYGL